MAIEFKKNQIMSTTGQYQKKGQKGGVSASASQNIRKASQTSIFSLNTPHGNKWVAGKKGSVDVSKQDFTAARYAHNSRPFTLHGPMLGPAFTGSSTVVESSGNNTVMTMATIGSLVNGTFGLLNKIGVIGNNQSTTKTQSATQQLATTLNSGSGMMQEVSQWSNKLATSFNSGSSMALTTTLEGLASEISSLDAQTADLSAKATEAKNAEQTIQSSIKTQETVVAQKQEAFDKSKSIVSQKEEAVKSQTTKRDAAQQAVSKADADYGKACEDYTKAHDAVVNKQAEVDTANAQVNNLTTALNFAETELKNTPETIPGPNGTQITNPAHTALKAKVENLKQQKADAETKRTELENELTELESKKTEAETAKKTAFNNLGDAKDEVQNAEKTLETAQKDLDNAKSDLQKAQQEQEKCKAELEAEKAKLDSLKSQQADGQQAIEDLQQHLTKIEQLRSLQTEYQGKIPDLQKAEAKKYTSLTKENLKLDKKNKELENKHNFTDNELAKGENQAWDTYSANLNVIDVNNMNRADIAQAMANLIGTPIDTTGYESITFGGQTFYRNSTGDILIADELPDNVKTALKS